MRAERTSSPRTVEEFLDWAEGRDGRYELEDGAVIAMAPETVRHVRSKGAIFHALSDAIRRAHSPCEAFVDGLAVRIDSQTSYIPDALVQYGDPPGEDEREAGAPVVVVEVLSPSTGHRDISAKLRGYFRVPAIQHYLIVHSENRLVIHHRRGVGDEIATRILAEGHLVLEPPGLTIAVADMLGLAKPDSEDAMP